MLHYILKYSSTGLMAQLSIQQKARLAMYHSCPSLMLTHQSTGTGLQLKAWVDFPAGMWTPLPRVPSYRYNTSTHQGAFALFIFYFLSISPLTTVKKWLAQGYTKCKNHCHTRLLAVNCRSIRSVQPLRAQLEQAWRLKQRVRKKVYVSLQRQIDTDRDKNSWRRMLCKYWAVIAEDINRIKCSQHNSVALHPKQVIPRNKICLSYWLWISMFY